MAIILSNWEKYLHNCNACKSNLYQFLSFSLVRSLLLLWSAKTKYYISRQAEFRLLINSVLFCLSKIVIKIFWSSFAILLQLLFVSAYANTINALGASSQAITNQRVSRPVLNLQQKNQTKNVEIKISYKTKVKKSSKSILSGNQWACVLLIVDFELWLQQHGRWKEFRKNFQVEKRMEKRAQQKKIVQSWIERAKQSKNRFVQVHKIHFSLCRFFLYPWRRTREWKKNHAKRED